MKSYRDIEKRLAALERQYQAEPEGMPDERARQAAIVVTNFQWSSYFQCMQATLAWSLGDSEPYTGHPYFCGPTEAILRATDAQLAGRVRPELATAKDRMRRPGPDISLAEVFEVTFSIVSVGLHYAEHHPDREAILAGLARWLYTDYGIEWDLQRDYPGWLPVGGLAALEAWWFTQGEDADGIQEL